MRPLALGVAISLALPAQLAQAVCNSEDGNIPSWTGVNYTGVLYGEIPICRTGQNITATAYEYGIAEWNRAVGKELLVNYCGSGVGLVVVDWPEGDCGYAEDGRPNPACADMPTDQHYPEMLRLKFTPTHATYSEEHQKHGMSHETGHGLGFDHYTGCTSVMTTDDCGYDIPAPTALDEANFYEGYHVEAVTNLQGWSNSPGDVFLAWNQVNSAGEVLCNESGFSVVHDGSEVASVGQDGTYADLDEQPAGSQSYTVRSLTGALPGQQGAATTGVMVQGAPKVLSIIVFGPAPVERSDTTGRYQWIIGELENPEPDPMDVRIWTTSSPGVPSGCTKETSLILPGNAEFTMAGDEHRWTLWRTKYECHAPAVHGLQYRAVTLCIEEQGELEESCKSTMRALLVE